MTVNFLYPVGGRRETAPSDERLLYRLSLDRSFAHVCADVGKRERFLGILSALTDDPAVITYRQDILRDLERHPEVLPQLSSLFARFEELRLQQRAIGRDEYLLRASGTASSLTAKNLLGAQALCLKRALMFVRAFGELLAQYVWESEGLRALEGACRDIYGRESFAALLADCAKYESFGTGGFLDFRFTLNTDGHIDSYALTDHRYIRVTDPELKRKGLALFRRVEEEYPCERVYPTKNDFYESLTASALTELAKLFASLSEEIFARFAAVGDGLDFYEVALSYIEALAEKGAPCCYPRLSASCGMRAERLYDLLLLMTKQGAGEIVSHDIVLPNTARGLVLFGDNGSGKTVWLRSIGTAQLLAQAGLPLPCTSAELPICSQLAARFSEAEKEFCEGNEAGRFEQEVRELAAMTDTLRAGAMVFLNETFQSTAYAEGAEGLCHLLRHFTACGIRWVLVSHLHRLEEILSPEEATVFHTGEGYRIR